MNLNILEIKIKKLVWQIKDLEATVSKFTNRQQILNLLLDNQRFVSDKSGIRFSESSDTYSQKPFVS